LSATSMSVAVTRNIRPGLLLFFCLLASCNQSKKVEPLGGGVTSDRALVILSTELRGYIAPCGCTSNPLGGIAKFAQLVEDKKRSHGDPVLVTSGNFLFESATSKSTTIEQDEARAKLVAEVYRSLGVFAQVPGPNDLAHEAFLQGLKNPWLADHAVVEKRAGELFLVFVGLRTTPKDLPAFKAKLAQLRARPDVDAVIGLSSLDWQSATFLAKQVPELDVLVSAGGGDPHAPATLGSTVVIDGGEQGQHVGLLELVRGEKAERWRFFDAGARELSQLQKQLAALESEISSLPKDVAPAARELRLSRREELARQIADLQNKPPAPPKERYLRYTTLALTKKMPELPAVAEKAKAYNATLCDSSKRATASLECEKAPEGSASYVGSATCAGCHPAAMEHWKTTKHARAVETLETAGKLCDLGCIGCHTTGFNAPGGFCSPQKIGALANVGCEMCHGAGSLHVQTTKVVAPFVKSPGVNVCLQCHTKEHSDLFEFEKYKPRILGPGHGEKK
jgi:hypothetical protein